MAYLDTSVLAAYYCPETLSSAVAEVIAGVDEPVISPLVEVELCSALAIKVRRNDLDTADAERIFGQFRAHLMDGYYRVVPIRPGEYELARDWLRRFISPLRALDALHLAAASSEKLELLTTDKALAKSAGIFEVPCILIE